MKKDKAEMMRRLRKQRKEQGLVELRVWLTPKHKTVIEKAVNRLGER